VAPDAFKADIFIVTHDHLDHLDPETVSAYAHKADTCFVAPRLAAKKLVQLGVPPDNIARVDAGESAAIEGIRITGVYAVPTEDPENFRKVMAELGSLSRIIVPEIMRAYWFGD
jgi:L-ascorbate 6-phosphate lactonase